MFEYTLAEQVKFNSANEISQAEMYVLHNKFIVGKGSLSSIAQETAWPTENPMIQKNFQILAPKREQLDRSIPDLIAKYTFLAEKRILVDNGCCNVCLPSDSAFIDTILQHIKLCRY